MNRRPISSAADLHSNFELLKPNILLKETEDSWEVMSRGLISLTDLCQNGACDFPAELLPIVRSISRPLTNSLMSERTRLSGVAIDLIIAIATGLGKLFKRLLPFFFPSLLALCGRPNKVTITRAKSCILSIIETTQLPSVLPYLHQYAKDKSTSVRLVVAEGTLTCLNCFNPPDLEKDSRANEIEAIIRVTVRDAQADVRATGRKVFEAYKLVLPKRVDSFTSPLSPTMKKYLDIKIASNYSRSQAITKSNVSKPLPPGNTLTVPSSLNFVPGRAQVRSVSSSTLLTEHTLPKVDVRVQRPAKAAEAAFVPIRPVQGSKVITASRSTSVVDPGSWTSSTSKLTSPSMPSKDLPSRPTFVNGHRDVSQRQWINATSGPRRIPIDEGAPKPFGATQKVDTARTRTVSATSDRPKAVEKINLTKSRIVSAALNPSNTYPMAGTRNDVPKLVGEKKTINLKPKKITSGVTKVRSGGATQPTLSQLARIKYNLERKQIGRGKLISASKSSERITRLGNSKDAEVKVVIQPTEIPLPPSPAQHPVSPLPGTEETYETAAPFADLLSESEQENSSHGEPVSRSSGSCDETALHDRAKGLKNHATGDESSSSTKLISEEHDAKDGSKTENRHDEYPTPQLLTEAGTPSSTLAPGVALASETPISSLLSSIQQGFLFTPSSPLSPPQSYLAAETKMQHVPIPFPSSVNTSKYMTHKPLQNPKPFMFGTEGQNYERLLLGDVEILAAGQ